MGLEVCQNYLIIKNHLLTIGIDYLILSFPLNGIKSDPEVYALEGIMSTYANTLSHIELSCPTIFGPVLEN